MTDTATHADQVPTLARRIIDLPDEPTHVFIGLVASHFATADTMTRAAVERYVDESMAVTR